MSVFKAYDIRGLVPQQLDADLAYGVGRAAAHFFEAPAIAVGRDARVHSPELFAALVRGINDEGVDVVDIGLAATPMLYYAVDRLRVGGGIMVTASHNPGQYNGFKLCREHAIPVGEASGLREIEAALPARRAAAVASRRGGVRSADIVSGYVEHVLRMCSARPALRVVIDCGNGMASVGLEPLLGHFSLDVERLFFEPDGTFPNHEADPLKTENLEDVCRAVREGGAQLGVAFDGDADRAIFVDETGRPISADLITALLARRMLAEVPGGRVLYDLRSSRCVAEEIESAGGTPEMCRVGHSFVKAQMRETGAIFAGELSGHFYFRFSDDLVADDGITAFFCLLDAMAEDGRPLSEMVAPLRRYAASGEINSRVDDPASVLEAVEAGHSAGAEITKLDGLLVRYDDWWFNLRPSNTEPVLRLNLEADTESRMIEERDRLLAQIRG